MAIPNLQKQLVRGKLRQKLLALPLDKLQKLRANIALSKISIPPLAEPQPQVAQSTATAVQPLQQDTGVQTPPFNPLSPTSLTENLLRSTDKMFGGVPPTFEELRQPKTIPRQFARGAINAASYLPVLAERYAQSNDPEGFAKQELGGLWGMLKRFPEQAMLLLGAEQPLNPLDKLLRGISPESPEQIKEGLRYAPEEPLFTPTMLTGGIRGGRGLVRKFAKEPKPIAEQVVGQQYPPFKEEPVAPVPKPPVEPPQAKLPTKPTTRAELEAQYPVEKEPLVPPTTRLQAAKKVPDRPYTKEELEIPPIPKELEMTESSAEKVAMQNNVIYKGKQETNRTGTTFTYLFDDPQSKGTTFAVNRLEDLPAKVAEVRKKFQSPTTELLNKAKKIAPAVGLAAIPTIAALSDDDTRDNAVATFGLAGAAFLAKKSGAEIIRKPKDIGISSAVRTPTNLFGAIPGQKANYGKAAQEASRTMALGQRNEIVRIGMRDERYAGALKVLGKNKAQFGKNLEKAFDIIEEPTGKFDKGLKPEELKAVQTIRQESQAMKNDIIQRQREAMRNSVSKTINREWRDSQGLKGVKLKDGQKAELSEAINKRLEELIPSEGWGIENYLRHLHPGNWDVWTKGRWIGAAKNIFEAKQKIIEDLANHPELKIEDYSTAGRAFKGFDVQRLGQRHYYKVVNDIAKATDALAQDIVTSMRGKLGTKEGRKKFAGFLQKREGFEGYRKDLSGVLDVMNVEFERWRMLNDLNRPIAKLVDAAKKEGRSNTATEIESIFQHMWGRTPSKASKLVDATMQQIPGMRDVVRPLFYERAMGRIKNASYLGMVRFSPRFRLFLNRLQTYQTLLSTVTGKEWREGIKFQKSPEGRAAIDKFGVRFLGGGKFLSEFGVRRGQVAGRKPGLFADEARNIERAWAVTYKKAIDMGLSPEAANDYAFLKGVVQTQFLHLTSDVPTALRGPTTSTMFQFQRFPIKNLELGYQLLADKNYPGAAKWLGAQILFAGTKWATSPIRLLGGAGATWLGLKTYDKIRDEYGQWAADVMTWGLPALLGLDLSYSFQLVNTPYGQNVPEKLGNLFLGPAGNVAVSAVTAAFDTEGVETSALKRSLYAAASRVPSLRWIEALRAFQNKTDSGQYSFKDSAGREKFKGDFKDVIVKGLGGRTTREAEIDMIIETATHINSVRDQMLDGWSAEAVKAINKDGDIDFRDILDWNELWPEFPVDVTSNEGVANLVQRLERRLGGQEKDKLTRKLETMPTILRQLEDYRRTDTTKVDVRP